MRLRQLGTTDLQVSEICLGTMTWGSQNTEAEGHAQMDYALERGVTFWDTAELYPTNPADAPTYGDTERIIGTWLNSRGGRDRIVLASKVAGPGRDYIRGGEGFTPDGIAGALDASLQRLNTDYIDLYQLHWPNRGSYHFGQQWSYLPSAKPTQAIVDDMLATLETLGDLVKAGKIRHVGLSNETAWGAAKFMELAEKHGLPRMVSTQNEYSLMYRLHDTDLAEVSLREGLSLLPYSPLGCGWLTGKYDGGKVPDGSRFSLPSYATSQRLTPQAQKAADAYNALARAHGLDPAQMAIAFTLGRPFVASTIIGATTLEQLKTDIDAADVALSAEVMTGIEAVRRDWPMPY
jgi:aryl-alcohol dehydrogenase-like predicted oxidoreductase